MSNYLSVLLLALCLHAAGVAPTLAADAKTSNIIPSAGAAELLNGNGDVLATGKCYAIVNCSSLGGACAYLKQLAFMQALVLVILKPSVKMSEVARGELLLA